MKQRMGRAGRLFPGVNIRLYTQRFYENRMRDFDQAEIETAPLEKIYVQVKALSDRLPEQFISDEIAEDLDYMLSKRHESGIHRRLNPTELLALTVQPPKLTALKAAKRFHWLPELEANLFWNKWPSNATLKDLEISQLSVGK